jgi:hypothetical protein
MEHDMPMLFSILPGEDRIFRENSPDWGALPDSKASVTCGCIDIPMTDCKSQTYELERNYREITAEITDSPKSQNSVEETAFLQRDFAIDTFREFESLGKTIHEILMRTVIRRKQTDELIGKSNQILLELQLTGMIFRNLRQILMGDEGC